MVEPLSEEMETWLRTIAETCIAHMKYFEQLPEDEKCDDDQGLYNLETGFLTLYGLYKKGTLPPMPKDKLN